MAVSSLCEFHNSSQFTYRGSETVSQHALTFEASLGPTLSFQTKYQAAIDVMSKSWNELTAPSLTVWLFLSGFTPSLHTC